MDLDRPELRRRVNEQYRREHEQLGDDGTRRMLAEASERWDFSPELAQGGVLTFAHVGVADCGVHLAAAVNACLDSGADTVVAIGVLHAFTDEMERARQDVAAGGSPSRHETWGIQGPGLDDREEWRGDHSMRSLRHFWEAAIEMRGLGDVRLIERYPYLAGGRPDELPNLAETAEIAESAVIVATGDQFHHGIGYGTPADEALAAEPEGLEAAKKSMEAGISLLEDADYWGYNQHCVVAKSDDRDVAQLYRYLRGPMRGRIVDIAWSDATSLYDQPPPTWAAGGFIVWEKA